MFHIQIRRVSAGTKDSAIDRLRYIARTNRYAGRGDTVRHIATVNMPEWVHTRSGEDYWREADSPRMRANGRLLFTIEIAIPRCLNSEDQTRLVLDFVRLTSRMSTGRRDKSNLPISFAIHDGVRKDDSLTDRLPNPHAHILLSPSINDGVQRSSQKWFRRANSKKPEDSGAPRSQYIGTKRWLLLLRRLWARVANNALRRAGFAATLDHRSNRECGILTRPTVHVGPKGSYFAREGKSTSRTRRNLRIGKLNAAINALCSHLGRGQTLASEGEKEALEVETELQRRKAKALAQLEEELSNHPLAGAHGVMLSAATVLVYTFDFSHPSIELDRPEFERSLLKARQDVGPGWLIVRFEDRIWLLRPPLNEVIVIGPGFVATDATDAGVVNTFFVVIRALEFGSLLGEVRPGIRDRVVAISEEMSISVAWNISTARKPFVAPAP